jgi:glucose-6-phosphate 1-dehydrogenase
MLEKEFTNPFRAGMRLGKSPQPNTLVIFGATGDLTHRKLLPALYSLFRQRLLPGEINIVGFARREKSTEEFRRDVAEAIDKSGPSPQDDNESKERFLQRVDYVQGQYVDPADFHRLYQFLNKNKDGAAMPANTLFYLATPPSQYEPIIKNLGESGLNRNENGLWTRCIIEKPFGQDLESARRLNRTATGVFSESQLFRIDHYLGKETVQNLLVLRFANGIFEPIWNRRYVDNIQITVAESIGVEDRGKFYEETGILRDIVQNHILQLLCLVAMEPPSTFIADAVRDEKVKVLRAVKPISESAVGQVSVRGQYAAGSLLGEHHVGYLEEEGVSSDSTTETYVALRLELNNWRWAGVPFYVRTAKRLPKRITEIAIQFKDAPLQIFGPDVEEEASPNTLALNIQPDEGISLRFDSKVPGPVNHIRPVSMDFRYGTSFGESPPDAYERLLLDAMLGDSTLFTRNDENEIAWTIMTPILEAWRKSGAKKIPQYAIGTWGPEEAEELIRRDGRKWRRL